MNVISHIHIFVEAAKRKLEMGENSKNSAVTNVDAPEIESKENLPEDTTKQTKRKSKKKKKKKNKELPREELLTEKAMQRASEIIEMLDE